MCYVCLFHVYLLFWNVVLYLFLTKIRIRSYMIHHVKSISFVSLLIKRNTWNSTYCGNANCSIQLLQSVTIFFVLVKLISHLYRVFAALRLCQHPLICWLSEGNSVKNVCPATRSYFFQWFFFTCFNLVLLVALLRAFICILYF